MMLKLNFLDSLMQFYICGWGAWVGLASAAIGALGGSDSNQPAVNSAAGASDIANKQYADWQTTFQPVEKSLAAQALAAGSPEDIARAKGAANADVTGAFSNVRKQNLAGLEARGINPGSPAYQSGLQSTNIAEGVANAGAQTTAANNARALGYAKQFDVASLGHGVPSSSAAALTAGANAATNASNAAFNQNQTNARNTGYGLQSVSNWFGNKGGMSGSTSAPTIYSPANLDYGAASGGGASTADFLGGVWKDGGKVRMMTPHMRHFAAGGGVEPGLEPASQMGTLAGPGTGTSDSIPAVVDGQAPAGLSSGEFVMSAPVLDMTGEEVLTAINDAALRKSGRGLDSAQVRESNDVPLNDGHQAYRRGGRVMRYGLGA